MKKDLKIELRDYKTSELIDVMHAKVQLSISAECQELVQKCRNYLDERMATRNEAIYGINTGFGSLCDTQVSKDELQQLQENLVKSHAAGSGAEVSPEIVRLMIFLKILGLSKGYSAIDLSTLDRLVDFYNQDVLPVIYEQGSLGASGDLAPLAHMSLPVIGTGEVNIKGQKLPGEALEQQFGWTPLKLKSKEGIALLNGTQFMSAHASFLLTQFNSLIQKANLVASMSIDAYEARLSPFHASLHRIRKQAGQTKVSSEILNILSDSEMQKKSVDFVQDPYSFRCIPQVHGAVQDVYDQVNNLVENEINSVTDNPTIFPDEDLIISGGNFHGEAIALAMDQLKNAMHELASISERRVYKLISGTRGLPAFLVANPGLNSGFMIPQYTAASMVSRSKALCFPNSVDTIDSSNGQEDHVSMGANAALSCKQVFELIEQVLGIELLTAAQALDFRRPLKSSAQVEELYTSLRKDAPFVQNDRSMHELIVAAQAIIRA